MKKLTSTKKNISAAILRRTGLNADIAKGDGYFHFFSEDNATTLKLAALTSTSVDVYRLSDLTVGGWADAFDELLTQG